MPWDILQCAIWFRMRQIQQFDDWVSFFLVIYFWSVLQFNSRKIAKLSNYYEEISSNVSNSFTGTQKHGKNNMSILNCQIIRFPFQICQQKRRNIKQVPISNLSTAKQIITWQEKGFQLAQYFKIFSKMIGIRKNGAKINLFSDTFDFDYLLPLRLPYSLRLYFFERLATVGIVFVKDASL